METRSCPNTGIGYAHGGRGMTILLIHGFGEDHNVWEHTANNLRDRYHVIMPDLPGIGLSSDAPITAHSIENHALKLKEMLYGLNIDSCIVMGHSMGGYITLALEAQFPRLVKGIGLLHSNAFADDEAKKETRAKTISLIENDKTELYFKTAIAGLFHEPQKHANTISNLLNTANCIPNKILADHQRMMLQRQDRIEVLKNTNKPVLLVAGQNDVAVPLDISLQQSYQAPVNDFHILKNCGHMGMYEQAHAFLDIIQQHLLNFHIR